MDNYQLASLVRGLVAYCQSNDLLPVYSGALCGEVEVC